MTSIDQQALKRPAQEARQRGRSGSGWYEWLARAGLVAKGVSYGIVGVLAVKLAAGDGGAATSRDGRAARARPGELRPDRARSCS